MEPSAIRVGFRISADDIKIIDPASINSVHEGSLLRNLYSGLVGYDNNGNLQSEIAKRFYWDTDKLIFEFGDKVVANSGRVICAEDAAVSIKRILKLKSSTHTNIRDLLCPSLEVKSIFDDCEHVKVIDNKLVIHLKNPSYNSFLLQSLAAGDMAIVPASAIDKETLKIKDYTETSGPYFLEHQSEERWRLRSNKKHFLLKSYSPETVDLVAPTNGQSAADMFIRNEIDIISTTNNLSQDQVQEITKKVQDVRISKTRPIKLFLLQFSLPSLRKTSSQQRLSIGKKFKELVLEKYPLPIYSMETEQFFLEDSFGYITQEQKKELSALVEASMKSDEVTAPITFYWYNGIKEALSIFQSLKELEMVPTDKGIFHQAHSERLDLAMIATDLAFEENLAFLGYNFTMGTFGLNKEEGAKWLKDYQNEPSFENRAEKLRELHFSTLKNGVIIPLVNAPYTAFARNGFEVNLWPLSAATRFVDIRRN